ncbi:MAG TPA: nickel-binding protein [Dehalococcoidia bacterium]|nr:nickel-binding protein [Dehalococcoidia bacterium]
MSLFLIRRDVPTASEEDIRAGILRAVSCAFNFEGMRWVTSYWDRENERAYCVYEAQSAEQLRDHAERARVPCDEVLAVDCISPEDLLTSAGTQAGLSTQ